MRFGSELSRGSTSLRGKIHYRLLGHDHIGSRVRAFHVMKMLKSIREPNSILDAGSGEGCYSFFLSRKWPKAKVTAIDIDGKQIQECRLISLKLGRSNLEFIEGDLLDFAPFGRFDLILCVDVLEHILDDERVLKNLRAALTEDGVLALHVPRRYQRRDFLLVNPDGSGLTKGHVRDEYTEQEIIAKVNKAGYRIEQMRYTFGPFGSRAREMYYLLERIPIARPVLKLVLFPILMLLAYTDTLTENRCHQGFLFSLKP